MLAVAAVQQQVETQEIIVYLAQSPQMVAVLVDMVQPHHCLLLEATEVLEVEAAVEALNQVELGHKVATVVHLFLAMRQIHLPEAEAVVLLKQVLLRQVHHKRVRVEMEPHLLSPVLL